MPQTLLDWINHFSESVHKAANIATPLEKGLKGDWQTEGYRLEHTQLDGGKHIIRAFDKDGNAVGRLAFTEYPDHVKNSAGNIVYVNGPHQRKGLASAMYRLGEDRTGKKFRRSFVTGEGAALWNQPSRPFGELEKGLKGDWQKEGYVLKHGTDTSWPGEERHTVKIYHPSQLDKYGSPIWGKGIAGSAVFLRQGDQLKPLIAMVMPDHQRKGIASSLYAAVEQKTGLKVRPSDKQSEEAKLLWNQPNRSFGKSLLAKLQSLQKSKKSDLQSLASDPKGADVVNFAHGKLRDTLPNNQPGHENWANWYVRQYKANPAIHTPENQETLKHFMGMKHMPEIANFRFNNTHQTFEQGIQALKDAESKGNQRVAKQSADDKNRWAPIEGTKEIDLGNGWGWWNLNKPYSEHEGKAMNHCGNVEGQHESGQRDKIYSLRQEDPSKPGVAKPHITAIMNGGYLGEVKGHSNSKPSHRFGDAMVALLLHKKTKGLVGSGYAPEANFHGSDLTPEQYQKVISKKPEIFTPRKNDLPSKFKDRPDLNPEVSDPHQYMSDEELQAEHNQKYNTEAKILKLLDKHRGSATYGREQRHWVEAVKHVLENPVATPEVIKSIADVQYQPERIADLFRQSKWHNSPKLDHIIPTIPGDMLASMGLLEHPKTSSIQKDIALKHFPGSAIKSGALDHHQYVHLLSKPGAQHDMVVESPNLPASVIDHILDTRPSDADWSGLNPGNKNINQQHINKMLEKGYLDDIAEILEKRHDLTVPKEKFDQLVGDKLKYNPRHAEDFISQIKDHPLFDKNNIAQSIAVKPYTGYGPTNLYGHPKISPELKQFIKDKFEFHHINTPDRSPPKEAGIPTLTEQDLANLLPIFQENADEYKQKIRQRTKTRVSDFHTPDEAYAVLKDNLDHKSAPTDMLDDAFNGDKLTPGHKQALLYHPGMPRELTRRYAKYLKKEDIIDSAKKLHNIKDAHLSSEDMDQVIKDWTSYPPEEGMRLGIWELLGKNDFQVTPDQAKLLIQKGFLTPKQATNFLTPEDREAYAQNMSLRDKYHMLISWRKDKKELPLKEFRQFYRDITPESSHEEQNIARDALHEEGQARKHQLITRTLGPGAKPEDLERYKYSHDRQVAEAAQDELKRRAGIPSKPKTIKKIF